MIDRALRAALFALPPETAHRLALAGMRALPAGPPAPDPALATTVAGLRLPAPLGLAAGFDKNAVAVDGLLRLGFGSVEVGTVTPKPQAGNPRPRLFRLGEDRAIINRLGFNNDGAAAVEARLRARRAAGRTGVVGVNIGANKDAADRIADYAAMTRTMAPLASYLTLNVSSPNTPGLRALQDKGALADLLAAVIAARGEAQATPPVFLKVAPDLAPGEIDAICAVALDHRIDALIVSNTTVSRPSLRSPHAGESGGLSGEPLRDLALRRLRDFRTASGGAIPLIGVGGIATAEDAWARIRAGASLVQLYTAFIFEGPETARAVNRGLLRLMRRDGFDSVAEAVGSG